MLESGFVHFRVGVTGDRCLGFVALGHEAMGDLDLYVHNRAGVRVAWDERHDAHPFARLCVRGSEDLHVLVRSEHGAGEVGVLVMVDPPAAPPDLDDVLHVRTHGQFSGPRVPRASLTADATLPDAPRALELNVARLVALGYRREGTLYSGRFDTQPVEARETVLQAGECYVIAAAGGRGIDDLDLQVLRPGEEAIDDFLRDHQSDNHPIVRICPNATGPVRIEVRAAAGTGAWAMAVYRLAADSLAHVSEDIAGVARARTLELLAEGRRRQMRAIVGPDRYALAPGVRLRLPLTLRAGECYLLGAASSEAVPDMDLALLDGSHRLLAADTVAIGTARVFHCPTRTIHAHVEVNAEGGRGEVVFVAQQSSGGGASE